VTGPGRIALRSLSAAVVVGFSVFAFGFQGPAASIQQPVGAAVPIAPPTGVVGPELLDPDTAAPAYPITGSGIAAPAKAPTGRTVSSSTVKATKTGTPKSPGVASSALRRPAAGFLMAPLEVLTPSSPFGQRRSPITGELGEFHWGQDFAAACGTRVYAADAGVVRAAGWHPWGGGNRVEIDHGNGLITTYNHLQGIAVEKGDHVKVGDGTLVNGRSFETDGSCEAFTVHDPDAHQDARQACRLEVVGGRTHLRGELIASLPKPKEADVDVASGQLFLVSDNRQFPWDSREFGTVERSTCAETVVYRLVSKDGFFDVPNRLSLIR